MKLVVIAKCCIPLNGKDNTPDTGVFVTTEEIGQALIANGSCKDAEVPEEIEASTGEVEGSLNELGCMTDAIRDALLEVGIDSPEAVLDSEIDDLVALKGIGEKTAVKLHEEAAELFE